MNKQVILFMLVTFLGILPVWAQLREHNVQKYALDDTTQVQADSTKVEEVVRPIMYWVDIGPGVSSGTFTFRIEWSQVSAKTTYHRREGRDTTDAIYAITVQRWSDGYVEPNDTSLSVRFDDTSLVRLNGNQIIPLRIGRTQVHVKCEDHSTTVPIHVTKQSGRLYIKSVLESF